MRNKKHFPSSICPSGQTVFPHSLKTFSLCTVHTTHLVRGKRRGEVMTVKIAACVDMGEADRLSALDRGTSIAEGIICPSNTPVAVTVFCGTHPSYRLLPTTCVLHTHKQWAQKHSRATVHTPGERKTTKMVKRLTDFRFQLLEHSISPFCFLSTLGVELTAASIKCQLNMIAQDVTCSSVLISAI